MVIGATNRIDTIDPALRRPGRFDREFPFTLPSKEARREILKIHTKEWQPPLPADAVDDIATRCVVRFDCLGCLLTLRSCVGYCGADIKALVTEASLRTIRRKFPQIYESNQKLLINPSAIRPTVHDFFSAMHNISPASHRAAPTYVPPLVPTAHLCTNSHADTQRRWRLTCSRCLATSCKSACLFSSGSFRPSSRASSRGQAACRTSWVMLRTQPLSIHVSLLKLR